MNELLPQDINVFSTYIVSFLFILIRTSIFVSLLPIIGSRQMPMQFRIGLSVFIAMLLTPVVAFEVNDGSIPMIIVRELFLGIALGMAVRFIFMAVNMAGSFVSHTMGMSIATTFNPEMGQSTQIAEIFGIIAMLFFLATDAHHELIFFFVKSFEILPAGEIRIGPLVPKILSMGTSIFVLTLKIAAPVIVCLLISHILSGFLYKAAPQMNIFFVTLPLNIFLGFLLMILSIPVVEYVLKVEFSDLRSEMTRLIMMAKG